MVRAAAARAGCLWGCGPAVRVLTTGTGCVCCHHFSLPGVAPPAAARCRPAARLLAASRLMPLNPRMVAVVVPGRVMLLEVVPVALPMPPSWWLRVCAPFALHARSTSSHHSSSAGTVARERPEKRQHLRHLHLRHCRHLLASSSSQSPPHHLPTPCPERSSLAAFSFVPCSGRQRAALSQPSHLPARTLASPPLRSAPDPASTTPPLPPSHPPPLRPTVVLPPPSAVIMLSKIVLALALGSAAAFTPANRPSARTAPAKAEVVAPEDTVVGNTKGSSGARGELEEFATKQVGWGGGLAVLRWSGVGTGGLAVLAAGGGWRGGLAVLAAVLGVWRRAWRCCCVVRGPGQTVRPRLLRCCL